MSNEKSAAQPATVNAVEPGSGTNGERPARFVSVGIGIGVLLVAAVVTLVALAQSAGGGEPDRIATISTAAATTTTPSTSPRSAPVTSRDISITDEPIVIDADGNIVDAADRTDEEPPTTDRSAGEAAVGDSVVDDGRNLLGGDDPEDKLMPDVICLGLQDAQDEIQDHGVFGSKSKDASGKGRRQIWDRNWIVVDQEPAAGEKIGEFEAVLFVVKTNEEHDC